jgi:hypothetical protein
VSEEQVFDTDMAILLSLQEAFPTATPEQIADLYLGPIRVPMKVIKIDHEKKEITFGT